MTKLQFLVLYRQFLFRMVDLELLSANAQGDSDKLLGQFASLLVFLGLWLSASPLRLLIARTILVVGLFAVLSWDSMFLDRQDVLVLAPLPIRPRTLLLAKVAALGTALGVTVLAISAFGGIVFPLISAGPFPGGILDMIFSAALWRAFFSYWVTMFAAGVFTFGSVLVVQGVAASLLPRRHFLRLSALLQIAAFGLFISMYFLGPPAAMPSDWFVAFFHMLNGTLRAPQAPLLLRALAGFGLAVLGATAAFLAAYFRTLRKIIEEPDIAPGIRNAHWSPRFGRSRYTALVLFSVRTLLRSRQHRVILSFYLGVGFAITIALRKAPVASIVMMGFWVLGTRVVFAMPRELRANWIFRVIPVRGGSECLAATRRSLIVLAVAPAWAASTALIFLKWPWRPALGHSVVLGLLGIILSELCLYAFPKIPFTCSYLPGKSNFHIAFLGFGALLLTLIVKGSEWEQHALANPGLYLKLLATLCVAASLAWRRTAREADYEGGMLRFEELGSAEIAELGLHRDGVMPVESPAAFTHPRNTHSGSARSESSD